MREILFRGKRIDNGEWVCGSPIFQDGYVLIRFWNSEEFEFEEYLVAPESVSEYTGVTDKNGKKIFEGDVLVFCKGATHPIKVYWDGLGWKFLRNGKRIEDAFECNTISHIQYCEVIGNIHDNPELLKEMG